MAEEEVFTAAVEILVVPVAVVVQVAKSSTSSISSTHGTNSATEKQGKLVVH